MLCGLLLVSEAEADIKMLTSRRELGQRMRLVAHPEVRARRDIDVGRAAPEIPPLFDSGELIGDEDAALHFTDSETGESFLIDGTGGIGLQSHTRGNLQGTILLGGTNVLPNTTYYEVDLLATMQFSTTVEGYIDFDFDVTNPTLNDVPFTITLARTATGTDGGVFVFNPMSGIDQATIPFIGTGEFDLTIEWHLSNYIVPAGNSNFGIEEYNISWEIVPEPSTWVMLVTGTSSMLVCGVVRKRRHRQR